MSTLTSSLTHAATVLLAASLAFSPIDASAQQAVPPNRGGFTTSMGLPPTWIWSMGATAGVNREDGNEATIEVYGAFYHDILNPVTSALGWMGEAYFGRRGSFDSFGEGFDGGARLGVFMPVIRLGLGADYNIPDLELDFFLSLIHPLQRGGIFVNGGSLRVNYWPGRHHSTAIGFDFPVGAPFLGTSRPRNDHVTLRDADPSVIPFSPSSDLLTLTGSLEDIGLWIDRLTVPFTDQWDGDKDEALDMFIQDMGEIRSHLTGQGPWYYDGPRTPQRDVEFFHLQMERAFTLVTSDVGAGVAGTSPLGIQVAARARQIALDQVILPYNRLLGQKRRPDTTRGFGTSASGAFYEWLATETPVPEEYLSGTAWVFARYLDALETVREVSAEQWELQGRLNWLPLQLALLPEEHDEQLELDALVERAAGETFTRGSTVWYVENEQFQAELGRMILEAEDYHIIWIHDFRGYDVNGDPDEMAFKQVTEAYLPALIRAVESYDDSGKITQYMMILDQFYFQANGGRLWANLLQDPMAHDIDLPDGFEQWEDSIASKQAQLRAAVAGSPLMQAQARQYEEGWIDNLVKVHVNITQPADPTFWTSELFPRIIGLPDAIMRDHRKISFYDVSEADPYKGQAIYTGMGVGEHYIGAGWEDRALMVEGPALLGLRDAARQLLRNQGFSEDRIPWELRSKPFADDYEERIEARIAETGGFGWTMDLHNEIGFRPKSVSIFKATLYTLMPPGSVIKAPDSIWGSPLWGSMMLGHALRGGRSLVIAPAIANAPSDGFPQMSRAQEIMTRLVVADEIFQEVIEPRGGLMKVGLYSTGLEVGDVPGRIGALLDNLEATPWLADLYGFQESVLSGLAQGRQELLSGGFERDYVVAQEGKTAKLHMKGHYFATEVAWRVTRMASFGPVLRAYYEEIAEQNVTLSRGQYRDYRTTTARLQPLARDLGRELQSLGEEAWANSAMFLTIGSHNQNTRSLALDGEVAFAAAGAAALVGLPDFITIAGLCSWIEGVDQLEELFPGYDGLQRRISRFIRIAV